MNEFDIYLIFTAGPAPRSKTLRWAEKSPVSHIGIEYYNKLFKERWLLEANCFGVQTIPCENIEYKACKRFRLRINGDKGLRVIKGLIGNHYDYRGAFWILLMRLLKRVIKVEIESPRQPSNSYFCSELVAKFFSLIHLPFSSSWNSKDITPHDIYLYCVRHPETFEEIC